MPEQIQLEAESRLKLAPPEGFEYVPDLVSPDEEHGLIAFGESLNFQPYIMRGQASRRGIVRFGSDYGPVGGVSSEIPEIPSELIWLRDRAAQRAGADLRGSHLR